MSGGFVKVFGTIKTSSVWVEPHHVFKLWMTFLVEADRHGRVLGSIPGLANLARVTVEEAREAVEKFLAPDPYSRTKSEGGRRIREIDGGWQLINHNKYREMRTEAQAATAERVARHREAHPPKTYVYYVQDGGRVAVGTSKNPWARVLELQAHRPQARLVAIEEGSRELARERRRQFGGSDTARGREWFDVTPDIAAHLALVGNVGNRSSVSGNSSNASSASASVVKNRESQNQKSSTVERAQQQDDPVFAFCTRLAVAANKGLGQAVPRILASAGSTRTVAEIIYAADIPIEFAEQVVLDRALQLRPEVAASVRSLSYFTAAIVEAWERQGMAERVSKSALRRSKKSEPVPVGGAVHLGTCPECGAAGIPYGMWTGHFLKHHPRSDVPDFAGNSSIGGRDAAR